MSIESNAFIVIYHERSNNIKFHNMDKLRGKWEKGS